MKMPYPTHQSMLFGIAAGKAGCPPAPHHHLLAQQARSLVTPAIDHFEVSWEARFEELRTFYKTHGHCNVPVSSPSYAGLSLWVTEQRREYAMYQASGKKEYSALHRMTPARIVKLMLLNFCWEPAKEDFKNLHYRDCTYTFSTASPGDVETSLPTAIAWEEQKGEKQEQGGTAILEAVGDGGPTPYAENRDAEALSLAQSLVNLHYTGGVEREDTTKKRKLSYVDDDVQHLNETAINNEDDSSMSLQIEGQSEDSEDCISSREEKATDADEDDEETPSKTKLKSIKPQAEQQDVERRTNGNTKSLEFAQLPKDFVPMPWSVVVGRDKAAIDAIGNKRLHVLVATYLPKYATSENKQEKTNIISEIEQTIRSACGEKADGKPVGSFVKLVDGRWWEVEPWVGREKIGRTLREPLFTKYSSSSKVKRARNYLRAQQKKMAEQRQDEICTT